MKTRIRALAAPAALAALAAALMMLGSATAAQATGVPGTTQSPWEQFQGNDRTHRGQPG